MALETLIKKLASHFIIRGSSAIAFSTEGYDRTPNDLDLSPIDPDANPAVLAATCLGIGPIDALKDCGHIVTDGVDLHFVDGRFRLLPPLHTKTKAQVYYDDPLELIGQKLARTLGGEKSANDLIDLGHLLNRSFTPKESQIVIDVALTYLGSMYPAPQGNDIALHIPPAGFNNKPLITGINRTKKFLETYFGPISGKNMTLNNNDLSLVINGNKLIIDSKKFPIYSDGFKEAIQDWRQHTAHGEKIMAKPKASPAKSVNSKEALLAQRKDIDTKIQESKEALLAQRREIDAQIGNIEAQEAEKAQTERINKERRDQAKAAAKEAVEDILLPLVVTKLKGAKINDRAYKAYFSDDNLLITAPTREKKSPKILLDVQKLLKNSGINAAPEFESTQETGYMDYPNDGYPTGGRGTYISTGDEHTYAITLSMDDVKKFLGEEVVKAFMPKSGRGR